MNITLWSVFSDIVRLLTFRRPSSAVGNNWTIYLTFGLLFTLVAGIGRYWDNPRAEQWQVMGLGSVLYVFCLSLLLWAVIWPLRPKHWSYRSVLTFVTLTSPPALLYAIPVERFMSIGSAQAVNALFLFVVATWRVALLVWFLREIAGLSRGRVLVATTLPIALIIVILSVLNLEHVVFDLMAGNRVPTGNDTAYFVVMLLSVLSIFSLPVLLLIYIAYVHDANSATRN